jgi:hypothetical protein
LDTALAVDSLSVTSDTLATAVTDLNAAKDKYAAELAKADDGVSITVNSITLSYDNTSSEKAGLSIVKYFAKVQPTLSLVKNSDNELVVKITNPSDSAKSFTIVSYEKNGDVTSASLNGQNI